MPGLLDHVRRDFDRRLAIRRKMMAHLGVSIAEADAEAHRADLRTTLLSCASCPNPAVCEAWIEGRQDGVPMFCSARSAFLRLEVVTSDQPDELPRSLPHMPAAAERRA